MRKEHLKVRWPNLYFQFFEIKKCFELESLQSEEKNKCTSTIYLYIRI